MVPVKFDVGVKLIVPSELIVTDPSGLDAAVTVNGSPSTSLSLPKTLVIRIESSETDAAVTVNGSPSTSLSLVRTVRSVGVSSPTTCASFSATGASFTGDTVTVAVALSVPPSPSVIV